MEVHFEATDPLDRLIRCFADRWFDHIIGHRLWVVDADWEGEVVKALENPLFICPDNHYDDRECFYYHPGPNKYYLKVVVDFDAPNSGSVNTAYEVNEPEEEVVKWALFLSKS